MRKIGTAGRQGFGRAGCLLLALAGMGCGMAPEVHTLGSVTYSLTVTPQIVIDTVTFDDGLGQLVAVPAPASPWSQQVEFPVPGSVEAHARLIAVGAGTAKLRAVWSVDGVIKRDSAVASPAGAGVVTLDLPFRIATAPPGR